MLKNQRVHVKSSNWGLPRLKKYYIGDRQHALVAWAYAIKSWRNRLLSRTDLLLIRRKITRKYPSLNLRTV